MIAILRAGPRIAAAGLVLLGLHAPASWAQSNGLPVCTVSSPGISVVYDPSAGTANDSSSTITISCTRKTTDNTSFDYQIGADYGLNASGTTRRAKKDGAANLLSYQLWRNSGRTMHWGPMEPDWLPQPKAKFDFGSTGTLTATATHTYWSRAAAGQNLPPGEYKDTIRMTFYMNGAAHATYDIPITYTIKGTCSISSAPGNVRFNYTSFQPAAASASTSFAVTCSSGTTYTMALDATTGTMLGLNYALSISPTGTQTGTGSAQSATINGVMAAGQSGVCSQASCTATKPHNLVITY